MISKERLEEIRDYDTCVTLEESAEMARRLLAVEGPEPVAYIGNQMLESLCNEGGRSCGRVWRSNTDEMSGESRIPLYTAAPAPVAQFWIEGNEPSEFGRYWVRYETDVGPQYCSAKWMEHNFCASSSANIHKIWLADHSRSINALRGVTHYTKLPDPLKGA